MSATLVAALLSALPALAVILRFVLKKNIEKEIRNTVELEQELEKAEDYKRTRDKLDEVSVDATADELREWLRKRGQRKP